MEIHGRPLVLKTRRPCEPNHVRNRFKPFSDRASAGVYDDLWRPRALGSSQVKQLGWNFQGRKHRAGESAYSKHSGVWRPRDSKSFSPLVASVIATADQTPEAIRPDHRIELPGFGEIMRTAIDEAYAPTRSSPEV